MREPDDRPGPLALSILSAAVVAELKADAEELAKLFAALNERERERMRALLFGPEV
ncbi:hypothetical protein GWG65_34945 [Bradyrhizobium sp. CSA207]|uniref:hypothetical protein n=1 Tax=Bradyrhizobium sp. CSA207 TaxID=2698826 RepID=UPI0023AFAFB6|nr:hypothetical protein [Bradyrhizobium sp. CSA207]MDE5446471.1 hypothetical protein [Bradyrhizobium sp. CSA207]